MSNNKKYWTSVEELKGNSIVEKLSKQEFPKEIPTDAFLGDKETLASSSTSRRDFLKYVGFTTAAASLAACEGPVIKTIPYVVKPNDIIPGVADYYATSIADGFDFASVLVKVREGRPIKIGPNLEAKTNNQTNARVQASVLSLYDNNRLKKSSKDYATFDKEVKATFDKIKNSDKKIVFLTGTMASPSTDKLLTEFTTQYPNTEHVIYDAVSETAALDAFQEMYGSRVLPNYNFAKANVIVSIGADFLGDWQGGGFESGYAKNKAPKNGKMSKHIQFESNLTLTGANADQRFALKPSKQIFALINLYNKVTGQSLPSRATSQDKAIKNAATQIKSVGSKAVVVTGIQNKNAQLIVLALNNFLQSEALDVVNTKNVRQGDDTKVAQLIADMKAGKVGAIITHQTNPAYTLNDFTNAVKKVPLNIAFSISSTETTKLAKYVNATPHYLESWGDVNMQKGQYNLIQPTINKLFDTRQFQEALLSWTENTSTYYNYLKNSWTSILNGQSWNNVLHNGTFNINQIEAEEITTVNNIDLNAVAFALARNKSNKLELALYTKVGLGDGQQANNPWLQELPDPITRTSWDNYLLISRVDAEKLELKNWIVDNGAMNGSLVDVSVGGKTLKNVPVYIQPGQAVGSVGLAYGYGRIEGMQEEMQTGVNAYLFVNTTGNVNITKVEGEHKFACVQTHHTMMGRDELVNETSLSDFINKPKKEWNKEPKFSIDHQEVSIDQAALWETFDDSIGTKFNLAIDLATCTACASCVIACHAENNVPVVGKQEIRLSRDMHWLRIDRYYTSDMTNKKGKEEGIFGSGKFFNAQELPQDQPEVSFQPVMCMHCNNAPCESVCPVAATSHGRQGQNQMAYNRCVGTRYCANNCPYRVRRFNWFKYSENSAFNFNMNNDLGRMVLNPDVVVRSRGVMEKCSMCIQMTQETILQAKKEGRPVKTDEFSVACVDACSTGAMTFGDVNNPEDKITKIVKDKRTFKLLEFIGTKPNVVYQLKVRNS
ncbi:MAG: TAT-variant-translocated molybdopterin oxidoreductase [Flavobacteriaceae bacterium]|nr:TAT-variant-translocated molybdopterin oxidoreductase [Flavobacteriaceae bacterium]